MSWFGDGTFKQDILERIESERECHGKTKPEAVEEVAEVLAYLTRSAFSRDEEIERVRAEAYEAAKRDLLSKLGKA
jgi:hypothetical protein